MMPLRVVLVGVAILMASACAAPPAPGGAPPVDRETITADEIGRRNFYSALDAVEALRPGWLNRRGADAPIQVYVDDNHIGGLESLRTMRLQSVTLIRHIDGIQAAARYGRGHEAGVILVTTLASGR